MLVVFSAFLPERRFEAMAMVSLLDIQTARTRIADHIRRTPIELSRSLSRNAGVPVHLKLEHRQVTGAFKLRGAINTVLSLSEDAKVRGVVAASTGNHGRALAHAARMAGIPCAICLSHLVPANKVEAIRLLGAKVHIHGISQDDAQREVDRLARQEGLVEVPPFDHPSVIAGQGTIGLEIVEDVPGVDVVLVPLSGGGLIAGIATAVKTLKPETRVIGISMERGAAMAASLSKGHPIEVNELPTLADSLGGGIGLANRWTFRAAQTLVDDVVLLSEAEIASGIRHAYFQEHEVVEGAAAVGIAAILAGRIKTRGPVVAVLTGRNIDTDLHYRVLGGANALERAA